MQGNRSSNRGVRARAARPGTVPSRRPMLRPALRRLLRSPVLVWPLALLAGGGAAAQVQAARDAEQRWGRAVPVVVAARPIPTGRRLRATDLRTTRYPEPLVPPGASRRARSLVGRVVAAPMAGGEPVLTVRLAHPTRTPTQVAVGHRRRAVTVAADTATPVLAVGDVVDLVAARGPADGPGPEGVVAAAARVLRADDHRVTVSIAAGEVRRVATAVVSGPVLVVLRGT